MYHMQLKTVIRIASCVRARRIALRSRPRRRARRCPVVHTCCSQHSRSRAFGLHLVALKVHIGQACCCHRFRCCSCCSTRRPVRVASRPSLSPSGARRGFATRWCRLNEARNGSCPYRSLSRCLSWSWLRGGLCPQTTDNVSSANGRLHAVRSRMRHDGRRRALGRA